MDFASRYALGRATAEVILKELASAGRLLEGEFRPGGAGREWCDPDALQSIRRRSLARLRKQVEPVDPAVFGRLLTSWQGVVRRRVGLDALLDAIETLQGAPLPATIFESEILRPGSRATTRPTSIRWWQPARSCGADSSRSESGMAAWLSTSRIIFRGSAGRRSRRTCRRASAPSSTHLELEGASFFAALHERAGGGYPGETVDALWDLVWKGIVTNDTFHALRAFTRPPDRRQRKPARRSFRSRRVAPPSAEGRWSLIQDRTGVHVSPTEWSAATAQQLLTRYGVLTREVAAAEGI